MADTETQTGRKPPKPVLSLTVGMVGHRLLRGEGKPPAFDAPAVEAAMARVLGVLRDTLAELHLRHGEWFAPEKPVLATINSLGEGADRIAFDVAGKLGLARDVVLPAAPDAYAATFKSPDARENLPSLLAQSRSTLILPALGDMADDKAAARSFEQAALTLLALSDLLIAVWDGEPAQGCGGTGETVDEAARAGAPIVVIDSEGGVRLYDFGDDEFPVLARHADELTGQSPFEARLKQVVEALVAPPADPPEKLSGLKKARRSAAEKLVAAGAWLKARGWRAPGEILERTPRGESQCEGLRLFYATPHLGRKKLPAWDWLRKLLLAHHHVELEHVDDFDLPPRGLAEPLADERNRPHFEAMVAARRTADSIGDHYAHAFRSAFIVNFVVGAIAVLFVGLAVASDTPNAFYTFGEALCVFSVFAMVMVARLRHWRRRWSEAREAAERLRASQPFWPLGVWPMSLHLRQPGWPGWYARAILRQMPVFHCDLNRHVPAVRAYLLHLVADQRRYHKKTAAQAGRSDWALEIFSFGVLGLSFLVLTLEIFHTLGGHDAQAHPNAPLRVLAVWLPAVATAAFGIRLLGDFEDTEIRSHRATAKLKKLAGFLEEKDAHDLRNLRTRARQVAKTMLDDLENWRITVESRNISA
jgi:hypothetical protein